MREGLIDIFVEAGRAVSTPTCGPCLGGHMGVLAEGERAVATTNRNFVGRMGHTKSEVYLAGPVAAASAVTGRIAHPEEVVQQVIFIPFNGSAYLEIRHDVDTDLIIPARYLNTTTRRMATLHGGRRRGLRCGSAR